MSEEEENIVFDKHIKQKYAGHTVSPPKELWRNINNEAALLETDALRKRIIFYKVLSLALAVFLIGSVIFYPFNEETKIAQNNPIEVKNDFKPKKNNPTKKGKQNIVLKNNSVNKNHIETNSENELSSKKLKIERTFLEEKPVHKNNVTPEIIQAKKIIAPNNISDKEPIKSTYSEELTDNQKNLANATSPKEKEIAPPTTNKNTDIQLEENDNQINVPILTNTTTPSDIFADNLTQSTQKNQQHTIDSLTNFIAELTAPSTKEEPIINNDSISAELNPAPNSSPVPPIVTENTLSKVSLSALFLPTYSSRSLKNITNNSENFYNNNQPVKIQYNAELNVGYQFSNKWIVSLGINYSSLSQELDLKDKRPNELPILMDPDNNKMIIYSSLGTIEANNLNDFDFAGDDEDDIFLDDEDDFASLNFREEQRFTFLNVPLTIGYIMGKKKLKLIVQVGLVSSFTIKSSSKIEIANIYKEDNIIEIKNYHQTTGVNLGATLSTGAKYDVGKRFSILFLPTYNTSFTNLNKNNSSTIKPYSISLSTGLQYHF
ncbi:MAG: hypothetical protein COA97_09095 [Flavobacteriales bacterium]|nr:MAG: hypothetical protein COA97_09095 [Flavobacteriales bacterium]